jgi:hypothetical protein
MRTLVAILTAAAAMLGGGCSETSVQSTLGAMQARVGESQTLLGCNVSVADLRWSGDYILVDVDAAPTDPAALHAKPQDVRFGLYGTLAHPVQATGLGSCDMVQGVTSTPLSMSVQRLTGTVCLGPVKEHSAVRGVYGYSPRERIPGTVAAYPAAFPVGVLPTNKNDTGLMVTTTSVEAWRADGTEIQESALGDPDGVHRQRLHAAGVAGRGSRRGVPRRIGTPRRSDDARGGPEPATAGLEPGVRRIWCFGADPARRLAGRAVGHA